MAFNVEAIHRALATQIKAHLTRDTNVDPFPSGPFMPPSVTLYPGAGEHINYFESFGPAGIVTLNLRAKIEVDGDPESQFIKISDYLSIGTGNNSSVIDAIHFDKTLGGLVDQCVALTAQWADPDTDPGVAWIPIRIVAKKVGALP